MPKYDWKQFFPYATIRESQSIAIEKAIDAFESGKKYFILEAGTGVGKSAIALTVTKYLNEYMKDSTGVYSPGGNILTTQKLLQEQYSTDFMEIISLKSASNYQCSHFKTMNCGESRKLLQTADKDSQHFKNCIRHCEYKKTKDEFIKTHCGITNFSYFLTETRYSGKITKKSLLVIDEAHNAPEELSKFIEVTFSDRFSKSFVGIDLPERITPAAFVKWIESEYYPILAKKTEFFEAKLNEMTSIKSKIDSGEFGKLNKQFETLKSHEKKVQTFLELYERDNWVMTEIAAEEKSGRKIEFKAIDISEYAYSYLFNMGQHVLLMSATIVNINRFAQLCGIKQEEYDSISIPCPFPIENRPILYSGIGKMTMNEIESTLPRLASAVKEILKEHKGQKGIIHCGTYRIANYLKQKIKDSRLLIHTSENRDQVLQEHIASEKATVILSPSMTEGVDLKGDLSRFQILCKVPYPYLGDPLTKKKMSKWGWWYDLQTAKTVIQSVGRSVRSDTDHAVTYILDSSWEQFFKKNREFFGKEFK